MQLICFITSLNPQTNGCLLIEEFYVSHLMFIVSVEKSRCPAPLMEVIEKVERWRKNIPGPSYYSSLPASPTPSQVVIHFFLVLITKVVFQLVLHHPRQSINKVWYSENHKTVEQEDYSYTQVTILNTSLINKKHSNSEMYTNQFPEVVFLSDWF